MWTQILVLVLVVFLGWILYKNIKSNPQGFSRENLGRSLYTLGILALLLIAFVAFLVLSLR